MAAEETEGRLLVGTPGLAEAAAWAWLQLLEGSCDLVYKDGPERLDVSNN